MFHEDKNKPLSVKCGHCKKEFAAETLSVISIQQSRFLIFACPNQHCKTVFSVAEAGVTK
jgi:hypothetical protein